MELGQKEKPDKNDSNRIQSIAWVQICWGVIGVIMIAACVLAFLKGKGNLTEISPYLGLVMLGTGLIQIHVYHKKQKSIHGSQWMLADGVSTSLLSLFLLFNQMVQAALIPFFLGVWELFSGILKLLDSMELKEDEVQGWQSFRFWGAIELLSGVASLLRPVDEFMGMNVVVAMIFLVQGCSYIFKVLIYPNLVK